MQIWVRNFISYSFVIYCRYLTSYDILNNFKLLIIAFYIFDYDVIPASGPVSYSLSQGSHVSHMVASTFMSLAWTWLVYTKSTSGEAEVTKSPGSACTLVMKKLKTTLSFIVFLCIIVIFGKVVSNSKKDFFLKNQSFFKNLSWNQL